MQRQSTLIVIAALAAGCGYSQSVPTSDEIGVLKVQGNVYMLVTSTGNIAAQVGDDGILLVDSGPAALAPKVAAALKKLADLQAKTGRRPNIL